MLPGKTGGCGRPSSEESVSSWLMQVVSVSVRNLRLARAWANTQTFRPIPPSAHTDGRNCQPTIWFHCLPWGNTDEDGELLSQIFLSGAATVARCSPNRSQTAVPLNCHASSSLRDYPNDRGGGCSRRREEADSSNRSARSASSLQEFFVQPVPF